MENIKYFKKCELINKKSNNLKIFDRNLEYFDQKFYNVYVR